MGFNGVRLFSESRKVFISLSKMRFSANKSFSGDGKKASISPGRRYLRELKD